MRLSGGRAFIALGIAISSSASCWLSACSGGDDTAVASDASYGHQFVDGVAPDTGSGSQGLVCAPSLPDAWAPPPFIPPLSTNTACTTDQIRAFYDACYATTATSAGCTSFRSKNATCIGCMETSYTDSAYGAVIQLSNGTVQANISGCIALSDGDFSENGCAAKVQALEECDDVACTDTCPIDRSSAAAENSSYGAYATCQTNANKTTCATEAAAASCLNSGGYACGRSSFEQYFLVIGDLICASGNVPDASVADADDGSTDASTDDASDAADD